MNILRFATPVLALTAIVATLAPAAHADEPEQPADTAQVVPEIPTAPAPDSGIRIVQEPREFHYSSEAEKKWPKPTPTLLKSMVFPGWGQFTNHRYTKAAIVFGLESWYIGNVVYHWHKSNQYLDQFRADPSNLDAYYDYDFHRGTRNDYMWWLGITVFVSMFDAYVDAHLRPYEHDDIPGVAPPKGIALVIKSF